MKKPILLLGGGGHCRSCIDVIDLHSEYCVGGIVDSMDKQQSVLGYPILGGDEDLAQLRLQYEYALVTVGQITSPNVRIRLYEKLKALGFKLPAIVSPLAYVSRYASVGEGSIVMHHALINANATVGNNCIVNSKALIEHDAIVGDHCHISTAAVVNGTVHVEQGCFIGSNATTVQSVTLKERLFIKAASLYKGERD